MTDPHSLSRQRQAAIVDAWSDAIVRTSFIPLGAVALRERLTELTDRLFALLAAESFSRQEARAIGTDLARLGYLRPESLGCMLETLAQQLAHCSDEAIGFRVPALLGEITAGFLGQDREAAFAGQGVIQQALVDSLERARMPFAPARTGTARW